MKSQIRPATATDCLNLAELIVIAGGGIVEILLQGLVPGSTPKEMLSVLLTTDSPTYTWRNAVVAVVDDRIAGMALAYPASCSTSQVKIDNNQLPADRRELMRPFEELRAPDSFYLCAIAVYPRFRRQGVGKMLLEEVTADAVRQNFSSLSLHVFEQNRHSVEIYRHLGFVTAGAVPCCTRSGLRYPGNILLMVKTL